LKRCATSENSIDDEDEVKLLQTMRGVVVQLSSSNPSVATVPTSTTIPVGAVENTFNITTGQVMTPRVATVSGTAGGATQNAGLTVRPVSPPAADSVAITRAEYVVSQRRLRVEATSTDASATLTAYVTSTNATIATLTNDGGGRFRAELSFPTNPGNVTVRSTSGGSATRAVVAQ
jgi:hypothetical protein